MEVGKLASRQGPGNFGFRTKTKGMTKLIVRIAVGRGHFILKDSSASMSVCCRWCWTGTWSSSICRWGSKHTHDSSGFPPWRESHGSSAGWPIQHGGTGWKSGKLLAVTCKMWNKSAGYIRNNVAGCVYVCIPMVEWLLRPEDVAQLSIITVLL